MTAALTVLCAAQVPHSGAANLQQGVRHTPTPFRVGVPRRRCRKLSASRSGAASLVLPYRVLVGEKTLLSAVRHAAPGSIAPARKEYIPIRPRRSARPPSHRGRTPGGNPMQRKP
jgi:hypothetical protein